MTSFSWVQLLAIAGISLALTIAVFIGLIVRDRLSSKSDD